MSDDSDEEGLESLDHCEAIDLMSKLRELTVGKHRPHVALLALGMLTYEIACELSLDESQTCPHQAVDDALFVVAAEARAIVADCEKQLGEWPQ
jgi:hypothetical protein